MRISDNMNHQAVRDSIHRSKERMDKLQLQSSTLKKLNYPSDDPIGSTQVLTIRTEQLKNDQYEINGRVAQSYLDHTDHALSDLSELLIRTKEIALGQLNSITSNEQTRAAVLEELSALSDEALMIANRRVTDKYLFGGFQTQKPPFDLSGKYLGDEGQVIVEIGNDIFLTVNLTGYEVFNTFPDSTSRLKESEDKSFRSLASSHPLSHDVNTSFIHDVNQEEKSDPSIKRSVNFFNTLQRVQIALQTGDFENLSQTLDPLDQLLNQVLTCRQRLVHVIRD